MQNKLRLANRQLIKFEIVFNLIVDFVNLLPGDNILVYVSWAIGYERKAFEEGAGSCRDRFQTANTFT